MWQDSVLLRFVEAVDFIDEEYGSLTMHTEVLVRFTNRGTEIGDTRGDSADRDEVGLRHSGDDAGNGRFP